MLMKSRLKIKQMKKLVEEHGVDPGQRWVCVEE